MYLGIIRNFALFFSGFRSCEEIRREVLSTDLSCKSSKVDLVCEFPTHQSQWPSEYKDIYAKLKVKCPMAEVLGYRGFCEHPAWDKLRGCRAENGLVSDCQQCQLVTYLCLCFARQL
jgi:hypothetical protein